MPGTLGQFPTAGSGSERQPWYAVLYASSQEESEQARPLLYLAHTLTPHLSLAARLCAGPSLSTLATHLLRSKWWLARGRAIEEEEKHLWRSDAPSVA
jgi:hypothetical protein